LWRQQAYIINQHQAVCALNLCVGDSGKFVSVHTQSTQAHKSAHRRTCTIQSRTEMEANKVNTLSPAVEYADVIFDDHVRVRTQRCENGSIMQTHSLLPSTCLTCGKTHVGYTKDKCMRCEDPEFCAIWDKLTKK